MTTELGRIGTFLGEKFSEHTNNVLSIIDSLKDGVSPDGDTLNKLYNITINNISQFTVPDIAARDALANVRLGAHVFVVDDGDTKWALYRATLIENNVVISWTRLSDPDLLNATLTAAQIKIAYESNTDRNPFTDALLTKLTELPTALELSTINNNAFGIIGDGTVQHIAADSQGETLHIIQGSGMQIEFDPETNSITFIVKSSDINHDNILNSGTNTHAEIDAHISSTNTSLGQLENWSSTTDARISTIETNIANLSLDGGASVVKQSSLIYMVPGIPVTIAGQSIVAVNEQIAGQTFALQYTTEEDYAQENALTGTDHSAGSFKLHNTAGGGSDSATKLLIHADGVNGSTEVIDQRGITPFGTHCAFFDGTAHYTIPTSYKMAFGQSQDFTIEFLFRMSSLPSTSYMLVDGSFSSNAVPKIYVNGSTLRYHVLSGDRITTPSLSANTFYEVSIVRRLGITTMYIGGISVGSWVDTTQYVACPLRFGAGSGNDNYFDGWMSNIHISKIARHTANYAQSTTGFTADNNTIHLFKFYDGHGSQFIRDDANSGHEIAIVGNGQISTEQFKFGTSSFLNGTSANSRLTAGYSKPNRVFGLYAEDFTIKGWYRPTNVTTYQTLFRLGDSTGYESPVIAITNGNFVFKASTNNTSWNVANDTILATANINAWNYVTLTRSGPTIYAFIDGILRGSWNVGSAAVFHAVLHTAYYCNVGGMWSESSQPFIGYIGEFFIERGWAEWTSSFPVPTTPATVTDRTIFAPDFQGANGDKIILDRSGSSAGSNPYADQSTPQLVFNNSAVLSSAQTRGGHATSLSLNGTNQTASITFATPSAGHPLYFSPNEYFCIEGWFYVSSLSGNSTILRFEGSISGSMYVYLPSTSGTPRFYPGAGGSEYTIGPASSIGWNHFAWVKESRGWVAYSNGTQGTFVTDEVTMPLGNITFRIGGRSDNIEMLNGYVDSIRITHGKPRYTGNFTPGNLTFDTDTALLWEFNGSVGQTWVKELSRNTTMTMSTNARTVLDGRYIAPYQYGASKLNISTSYSRFGTGSISKVGPQSSRPYVYLSYSRDWTPGGDYTIECWWRFVNYNNYVIAEKANSTDTGITWRLWKNDAGYAVFSYSDGTNIWTVTGSTALSTVTATYNYWIKLSAVRSGTTLKLYVNGILDATVSGTGSMRQDTGGILRILGSYDYNNFYGSHTDEIRISNVARYTSNYTPQEMPYGQQYVEGPFWIHTLNTSQLNMSAFSSVDNVAISADTPPGTSINYAVSFDGRVTWEVYRLGTWTSVTLGELNINGMTSEELKESLLAWGPEDGTTLDIAASLKTNNPSYSPTLDSVTVTMDEYTMISPVTDYSVKRKKAFGVQPITITRIKPGNAFCVIDHT